MRRHYEGIYNGKNVRVDISITLMVMLKALQKLLGFSLFLVLTGCYLVTFVSVVLIRIASEDPTLKPTDELRHMVRSTWRYLVLSKPRSKPFQP